MLTRLSLGEDELPPHKQLLADLMQVRQVLTPNGFTIRMSETPDGRHADFAPPVMLALDRCVIDQGVPLNPAEAEHRLHWDKDGAGMDALERAAVASSEEDTAAEWSERLFEESYGIASPKGRR
jgi:hypothetical protein